MDQTDQFLQSDETPVAPSVLVDLKVEKQRTRPVQTILDHLKYDDCEMKHCEVIGRVLSS